MMNNKRTLDQQESDQLSKVMKDGPIALALEAPVLEPATSSVETPTMPTPNIPPPPPKPAALQAPTVGTLRPPIRGQHRTTLLAVDSQESRTSVLSASADPDYYKNACGYSAIENHDLEDIYKQWDTLVAVEDKPIIEAYVRGLQSRKVKTPKDVEKALNAMRREFKGRRRADGSVQDPPRKSEIIQAYVAMVARGEIEEDPSFQRALIKKASKSLSGVLVVTVLTSPYPEVDGKKQRFSCEWDCHYCPNEPGQPRSYLHDEPSVLRANRNQFDPVLQFTDRCATLAMNGHPVDKIELLVLGGTWTSYPHQYQESFVRDLFYAANTFHQRPAEKRPKLPLSEEKTLNEEARVKIIGLTLETRPDCIDAAELRRMRSYGCTRVQVGMQHTDDGVLRKINRGCTRADMVRATRLLKDSCYKLDLHIMPNLPGSSVRLDASMFQEVLKDSDLQVDQWKVYPCEITPWTLIKKWFEEGSYVPYPDSDLTTLLLDVLPQIPPWVRVNRVVRDIPSQYILAGMDRPNLRQDLDTQLKDANIHCHDIRAREVKGRGDLNKLAELVVRDYDASHGLEHFLSFETPDRRTIFAFCRLRVGGQPGGRDDGQSHVHSSGRKRRNNNNNSSKASSSEEGNGDGNGSSSSSSGDKDSAADGLGEVVFPELQDCALVRELHVYGQLATADATSKTLAAAAPAGASSSSSSSSSSGSAPTVAERGSSVVELDDDSNGGSLDDSTNSKTSSLSTTNTPTSSSNLLSAAAATIGTKREKSKSQHVGLGTRLMQHAEKMAAYHGYGKVAVISGVGVRHYYRRLGYELDPGAGEFMIKRLSIPFRVRHHRCWSNKAVAWVLLPCVLAVLVALILAACGFLPSSSS